jgi:hypothetical protein
MVYSYTLSKCSNATGSVDSIANWNYLASNASGQYLAAVVELGDIYTSDCSGSFWINQTIGKTDQSGNNLSGLNWSSIVSDASGQHLVSCVKGGNIYTSSNFGTTWINKTIGKTDQSGNNLSGLNWSCVASNTTGQFLATCVNGGSIYISIDYGSTWYNQIVGTKSDLNKKSWVSIALNSNGGGLAAVSSDGTLLHGYSIVTNNPMMTLMDRTSLLINNQNWIKVVYASSGETVFAAVKGGDIYTTANLKTATTDSFKNITNGKLDIRSNSMNNLNWNSIAADSTGRKLVAVDNLNIYTCSLTASTVPTWTNQTRTISNKNYLCIVSNSNGVNLACCIKNGLIFNSINSGTHWDPCYLQTATSVPTNANAGGKDKINAIDSTGQFLAVAVYNDDIYTSNNYGSNWINQTTTISSLHNKQWSCIASDSTGKYLAASFYDNTQANIYTSNNHGFTWKATASPKGYCKCIASDSTGQFLAAVYDKMNGTTDNGIYLSSNYGTTWTKVTSVVRSVDDNNIFSLTDYNFISIASSYNGQYLAAIQDNGYIFTSNDNGRNWYKQSGVVSNFTSISIDSIGNYIFFCSASSICIGTKQTETSTYYTLTDITPTNKTQGWLSISCNTTGARLVASNTTGLYLSQDYGNTWKLQNNSTALGFVSVALDSTAKYLFAINNDMYTGYNPDACFNEGTLILTLNNNLQEEYVHIENLKEGDLVKTYKHGYRKIELIGKGTFINDPSNYKKCMYKMVKTEENGLLDDLIVTGQHSILVNVLGENEKKTMEFTHGKTIDDKYLLFSSLSPEFVKLTDNTLYTYYHFVLEDEDNERSFGVYANGILSESISKRIFLNCGFDKI